MTDLPSTATTTRCWTQATSERCTLDWTLENLDFYLRTREEVVGPSMTTGLTSNGVCQLRITFHETKINVVNLVWIKPCAEKAQFQIVLSYFNSENVLIKAPKTTCANSSETYSILIDSNVHLSNNQALTDNLVRIHFELNVYTPHLVSSVKSNPVYHELYARKFLHSINSMYQKGDYTDFAIKVGFQIFRVHKLILAACSPVFEAIFKDDPSKDCIEIEGFSVEAIQTLLAFMYSRQEFIAMSFPVTKELYQLAQKYEIPELKTICRDTITSMMTVANALEILMLADDCRDFVLKHQAIVFISSHPQSASQSDMCAAILQRKPNLLKELLTCKLKTETDGKVKTLTCDLFDLSSYSIAPDLSSRNKEAHCFQGKSTSNADNTVTGRLSDSTTLDTAKKFGTKDGTEAPNKEAGFSFPTDRTKSEFKFAQPLFSL